MFRLLNTFRLAGIFCYPLYFDPPLSEIPAAMLASLVSSTLGCLTYIRVICVEHLFFSDAYDYFKIFSIFIFSKFFLEIVLVLTLKISIFLKGIYYHILYLKIRFDIVYNDFKNLKKNCFKFLQRKIFNIQRTI